MLIRALANPYLTALFVYVVYQMLYTGYEARHTRRIVRALHQRQHAGPYNAARIHVPTPGAWYRVHPYVQAAFALVLCGFLANLGMRLWQGY